jgi:hypothetical protein
MDGEALDPVKKCSSHVHSCILTALDEVIS